MKHRAGYATREQRSNLRLAVRKHRADNYDT